MCGRNLCRKRGGIETMTEEQKKIKRYVMEIERALRVPLETKVRINHDLGTEIQLLKEQGFTADEIIARMGRPEEVAERFNEELAPNCAQTYAGGKVFFLFAAALALIAALLAARFEWKHGRLFDSSGIMIIGGSDGPTSIFIAGKISSIMPFAFAAFALALGMVSQFFRNCRRHSDNKKYLFIERILAGLAAAISAAGLWIGAKPFIMNHSGSLDTAVLLADGAAAAVLILALILLARSFWKK